MDDVLINYTRRLEKILFSSDHPITALMDLLSVALALAVFWALFFWIFCGTLRRLVHGKPWLVAAAERDYDRGGKQNNENIGIRVSREEHVELAMNIWPWMQAVCLQHLVGGMLCVPSILGLCDSSNADLASSLACLGILSEMGWEIQDILSWIGKRYLVAGGKDRVPFALIIVLAVHHSLTTLLGIPLILHYRSLKTLHWICFDLQAAAAVALGISEYTKLLDVSRPNQLFQFQLLTLVSLVVMVWTRLIHWIYLTGQFVLVWYRTEAWGFLVTGSIMALVFTAFSWVLCIRPCYDRLIKFLKLSAEYQALPVDVDPQKRRSSMVDLQQAAAHVVAAPLSWEEELVARFARPVDAASRRSTVPPSMMFGSANSATTTTTTTTTTRRASLMMLRASGGDLSNVLKRMKNASDSLKDD